MTFINGDLIPSASGAASLGVDQGTNAGEFDISSIAPFLHVHQVSGVFHDSLAGQSGVLRFNHQAGAFEVSVDGGATFNSLSAGAGVDSVGVLGDTNLTGNIDLASAANSGFLAIFDTANASPIQFAVDHLGLSGLWDFPTQGFNGSIVNSLSDENGTTSQGAISVVGASGISVDIVGQTMTIGPAFGQGFATCYSETFTAATSWTVTHNLGTPDVSVTIFNNAGLPRRIIFPDSINITSNNQLTVNFNTPQAGEVLVIACV